MITNLGHNFQWRTLHMFYHHSCLEILELFIYTLLEHDIQGGSNMTGTDLYVNKPHCAAAVRP